MKRFLICAVLLGALIAAGLSQSAQAQTRNPVVIAAETAWEDTEGNTYAGYGDAAVCVLRADDARRQAEIALARPPRHSEDVNSEHKMPSGYPSGHPSYVDYSPTIFAVVQGQMLQCIADA